MVIIIKKFFEFATGNIVVLFIGVLITPITTRLISPIEMGKYSIINTASNLLMIFVMLGVDQSYVRYFYEEENEKKDRLIINSIKIPLALNIILLFGLLALYKPVSEYLIGYTNFNIIIIFNLLILFNTINRFSLLEVRMNQKAKLYSLINILNKLLYFLFILLFYKIFKNNYNTLVYAFLTSMFVTSVLTVILRFKNYVSGFKMSSCNTSYKEMINYGVPFLFSMSITWVFQAADRIAIKQYTGFEQVGLYAAAMSIVSLLNTFQGAFTTFWIPVAYERYVKNKNDTLFFTKANKTITIVMMFIATSLILFKDLIIILLGNNYRDAVYIFPFLVFMPIMYTVSETTVLGINFAKKTKYHIIIAIISATFNIVGNLILVKFYGAKGAAISTGLAYIVFFSLRTYYSKSLFSVNYNLLKFYTITLLIYVFATYASFHKFNFVNFSMGILCYLIIFVLYKDGFVEILNVVLKSIKSKKN